MAEMSSLLEIFADGGVAVSAAAVPRDLVQRLRSDSARPGLERLLAILSAGIEDSGDGRLGFQSWSREQIEAVLAVSRLVVAALLSASVEQVGPVASAIVARSTELGIIFLERSKFDCDDLSLENGFASLLELVLGDRTSTESESQHCESINTYIEQILVIPVRPCHVDYRNNLSCHQQGFDCLDDRNIVENLLVSLSLESIQPDSVANLLTSKVDLRTPDNNSSAAKHFIVVHLKCVARLLTLCERLLCPPASLDQQKNDVKFTLRLSFSLRMLKYLRNLVKEVPCGACDMKLLHAVASYADTLPSLFKLKFDFLDGNLDFKESTHGSVLLQIFEEFLQFGKIVFYDSTVSHNIQACTIASMVEILASDGWRYDRLSSSPRPPLIYSPQVVLCLLKFLKDAKSWASPIHDIKINLNAISSDCPCESEADDGPSCHIRDEKVLLHKRHSFEQLLNIIFPASRKWIDSLLHLVFFLHSEGIKSKITEKSRSRSIKLVVAPEVDTAVTHEEEAIFGNLFSEPAKPPVSADVDQPSAAVAASINTDLPFQAASELLSFLKLCIFSPEWCYSAFENACQKVDKNHIDQLLSLLHYCPDGRNGNSRMSDSSSNVLCISGICFDLLQNLLVHHVLSSSLKDYLVDQVLKVEDGIYVYNQYSVALLANALILHDELDDRHMMKKICEGYVNFILQKARDICCKGPVSSDILSSLPSTFHLEIVLMAFHLSNDAEKASLVSFIFNSLRELNTPPPGFTVKQLFGWGLVVSRILLILRHVVMYPSMCPSWLLLRLRFRMREVQSKSFDTIPQGNHIPSWAFTVAQSLLANSVNEVPTMVSNLMPHLIDVAIPPASYYTINMTQQHVGLNLTELISTFSRILDFWNGKELEAAEELLLERYMFSLCWSVVSINFPDYRDTWFHGHNWKDLDVADVKSFLSFGLIMVIEGIDIGDDVDIFGVIYNILTQIHSKQLEISSIQSLDLLRNNAWISLVLVLLNAGLLKCSRENNHDQHHLANHSAYVGLLHVKESIIPKIFQGDNDIQLIKVLSSILKTQMQILHKAIIFTLDHKRPFGDVFSPLLLVMHTLLEKSKQKTLLDKSGCSLSDLESLYGLLPKLDEFAMKEDDGSIKSIIMMSLLHGFPSKLDHSDGALHSCVLAIKVIICFLDFYVKIKDARAEIGTDVICELLETITAVRCNRLFGCIHGKCDTVCDSLIDQKELSGYQDLFVLKQLEGFLEKINSSAMMDAEMQELLVDIIIDLIDGLRRDDSKKQIFDFFLGIEGVSKNDTELFNKQHGNVLVLINALDNCHTETVNLKVLNLLVDLLSYGLCSSLKQQIQRKLIEMDLLILSCWLEKRLLGMLTESDAGGMIAKGSSSALRESTMNFLIHLVSQPCEMFTELKSWITEALLIPLDQAFIFFDFQIAKAYFNFVVQFLNGDPSAMKQLIKKTIILMEKLVDNESLLHGLNFLFSFIGAVFGDPRSDKSSLNKVSSKLCSSNSFGAGSVVAKTINSRKNSESLVLPTNQESGSVSLDCDATSADEDDDDATSDGEFGSIDKDEEDDNDSERALASKVCTFTSSGSNFMEQHWYFCYTCDLTISKGCCSICAQVCHRGHRVVYSRSSRFFCDCGAGGVRGSSCQCLKPRKFTGDDNVPPHGVSNLHSLLAFPSDGDQGADSDSDLDDDVCVDTDNSFKLLIPEQVQDELPSLLGSLDLEGRFLKLCDRLLPAVSSRRELNFSKDKKVILGDNKVLSYSIELFQLKKAYKSGSLDLKIKADYQNSRELKSHLTSGSLIKSLLSISARGRLAAGEGDKVAIFDVGQLIGQPTVAPVTADKTNIKPLSKNIVRFEIVHLIFNPVVDNYLAVAGYEDCQVLTVNLRGEVTDRLAIELALQGAYIRRVDWVPGSQVQLMVVTNMFVKIYDLSQDNISPKHYFTLSDDIVDATLVPATMGKAFLLVLSEAGHLFRFEVSMEGNVGANALTDIIAIQDEDVLRKGLSLLFSLTYRLLILSYQDGTTLMGRLDANATSLIDISYVLENDQDGKLRTAGLHHWKELISGSGLFICLSTHKSNAATLVSLGPSEMIAQNLKYGSGLSLPLVGVAAYKPLSKDKTHCLVLQDDGSLQIYSHLPTGVDTAGNISAEQTKKLGSSILNNKAYAGMNPEFPLDFFEKTMCITGDVKFSSDAIKNGDCEGIRQRLASDDGFLEGPSSSGFKVTVSNSNSDIVMVGCRIQVGNTSASHIPSEVTIFQRVIKLDEGMRSWYDIPFTVAESLLADEEFTISMGRTFDGSTMPRVDSLEVYGRSKDEFGWKEKIDAVLDLEAHVLGGGSGASGTGKKRLPTQSSAIQEQVLADAIKLLSRIYSLIRLQSTEIEDVNVQLNKLKCRSLLETVFQSDREPLLQSAACRVLQAVFPKREIYYQVKDTMRLLGVVNSFPMLISRVGIGGPAAVWVIKEFTSQMHAVSKVALHRRSNLALFLETHGPEVIDGLIQVLWAILDWERPETQTINSIIMPTVELIYSYAECLALHGNQTRSVAPAVALLKKLLFAPYEAVQTSSSLAISSWLLQVPFPKQTIIPSDDPAESHVTAQVPSVNTASGNSQVMIEEDSTISSVQYCCDGCSTVPILRRRWHCNICPDFDLCEACYEVLDADQLPPPHSRDHPMSAIPIDIDSIAGDGNEIPFSISMDELSDASLASLSTEISMQKSSSSIHVLDTNESGDFMATLSDQTIVSISASQRALNSLLLRHLIEELNGWMETTSGFRAIPVMQLFYRLSSAVGGPFMDSSKPENLDLEKFVKWLLEEINLNKPFPAKARTTFGEVAILVFMFFTLMLRNWHQPGSDSSQSKPSASADLQDKNFVTIPLSVSTASSSNDDPERTEFASQLIRACSFIRQQSFLNYLMDILQQLVNVFKSSSGNLESDLSASSGCGSLLIVRRELPAGNFIPFFPDSYAKSHSTDMFADYHKLLLENTFRLVYSLVRPEKQEKSAEKDKTYKTNVNKDLKLDGFQDVLCSYISNPHTTFVRRYARRLFLHLCGSKTQYYSIRDYWQFSNEVKRLHKLISKSGGFENPVPYEKNVKLVKCLSTMSEVATARPRNWQKYCSKHIELLPFLMNGIFNFGEESVVQTLKLLNLAFYTGKDLGHGTQRTGDAVASTRLQTSDSKKKKKGEDTTENSSEKGCLDMEQAVEIFSVTDGHILRKFIDSFLLEWNSSNVRHEAKNVLYGLWHHGKQSLKESLLTALLEKLKHLPTYGQSILEYTELMTWLLGRAPDCSMKLYDTELVNRCLTSDVITCIFETLHSQNELLANHPNSRIYSTLSSLVEFDGYYLESEPCVTCSCPEVPYSRMKLESLKSESKFTDNRIIVKCTGSFTIQSITMNVHDAKKSKSVKVLNLYYNNRPVTDLSELKNNWSLWKRAKSCHLAFNQTELKLEFPIPITACNFMIELDSFYENLQASSLESLQCPRCSRSVTDKHGICSNCRENAYQCRQCRNINYENLDSFLCNECGYSKYGRFEFNFMAKPSFLFDNIENEEDLRKGLAAIESESENAHRRYQQLLGFKKPLLKLVSNIGENEIDSQQKDSVQQMMVSLPGPSCKVSRKIALLGVLYGEKCKAAFDSVSKSVQTLQGLKRVVMTYLQQKNSGDARDSLRFTVPRSSNSCYGCAITFVTQCLEFLQVLSKHTKCKKQLVAAGILSELFENNIHQGPKTARVQARAVLCALTEGDADAMAELNTLIKNKVIYCLEHHRSIDVSLATREELLLLTETCGLVDEFWEARLRVVFHLLFASIKLGAKHPAISEHIILPCLRIISQACTPPRSDAADKEQGVGKTTILLPKNDHKPPMSPNSLPTTAKSEFMEKHWEGERKGQSIPLLNYSEWEKGASYLDFVRRQYKIPQPIKNVGQRTRQDIQKNDYLALKYALKWKRRACRAAKNGVPSFTLGSWVSELILSACSQSIRSEVCNLINVLCQQSSSRCFQLLNLLMSLLPATLPVGDSAADFFELFFKMIDSETARLYLTVKGCLNTICSLITCEVHNIESQERSLSIDVSQGFTLHKLVELLTKFVEVPNIRVRFMQHDLLSEMLEALFVIRGLIVQKTKLISDCNRLLKELLDGLLVESTENKWKFIRACISGLQSHRKESKHRTTLFILEQLCNMICPSKPEPVYLLILNKAHTQEEFIRGSMTKNPYSSTEIGPLMRDVKNKICHQLDMLGLLEDDYGMELLVAGNIISLDLSISQVYEQVWKKYYNQTQHSLSSAAVPSSAGLSSTKDCPPMTVTYRLQGLDGEATEPMIKELEEEREESLDPEVEFAIAGAVKECGGLEIILGMIQRLRDEELKSNQDELGLTLNLLMYCCKIRENRRALLKLGALGLLLETARRAFYVDAFEPAEGILLIVESLTMEANESDIGITQSVFTVINEESGAGEQAKKIVLMFLERLCHPLGTKKSTKQQRNDEMVARILPYLTYGEPAAMEALIQHFDPYLRNWGDYDKLLKQHLDNPKDDSLGHQAAEQKFAALENFVRVSESLKSSSCGERLKDIILEKGIIRLAVEHLRENFAITGQAGFKSSAEWTSNLKLPSVPLILSMLRGLSRGHLPTQRCIDDEGILPLLHALEGVPGENEIGARAENLLDTLADKENNGDGFLGEKIHKLRHASRDEMRRRALRKREELLLGLGMRQEFAIDGAERIVVSQPAIEGLEDVEEEEDGLACMVCREGYTLRPNDMLGVYSYSKRVNLGAATSSSARGDYVYTTVSHFNVIHFQCHQEAKRADAALKNPKKEWEGATLRNNETLCNCIFPLRGPSVPVAQYVRFIDQYWDNLNALGRADGSRLRLLTYDIVLMLARFATGALFSTDCKGGGKESNSRFLPFMIQMASYLLDLGSPSQQRRTMTKSVAAFLSNASSSSDTSRTSPSLPGSRSSPSSSDETVQFMMVNSLLSESYEEWLQHRPAFLRRGIYSAYMQHKYGRSTLKLSDSASRAKRSDEGSSTDLTDSTKLFSIVQPMLIYAGLIEQLQQFFKLNKRNSPAAASSESTGGEGKNTSGLEKWEITMKERLVNIKEMSRFSEELLSWLEDMTNATDLQEAFDIMGALADALSGGISRCEDFVRAAIVSGKN